MLSILEWILFFYLLGCPIFFIFIMWSKKYYRLKDSQKAGIVVIWPLSLVILIPYLLWNGFLGLLKLTESMKEDLHADKKDMGI
jgi:hypothetical protein